MLPLNLIPYICTSIYLLMIIFSLINTSLPKILEPNNLEIDLKIVFFGGTILMLIVILLIRISFDIQKRLTNWVCSLTISEHAKKIFFCYTPYGYLTLLLSCGSIWCMFPPHAFLLISLIFFVIVQLIILTLCCTDKDRTHILISTEYLAILFGLSGFAALIYQVIWQKLLFAAFGVNIESITVIVSIFIFGIGMGSLLGGFLSKKFSHYLIPLFIALELLIGFYGLFSMTLIDWMSHYTAHHDIMSLTIHTYLILAVPTLLMGATLPILVSYLNQYYYNIGKSVSILYAVNVIGSALAAFLTVTVLFVLFGKMTTLWIAALCNFSTALLILISYQKMKKIPRDETPSPKIDCIPRLPFSLALFLSFIVGYISLSQEILWFRIFNLATASPAPIFGLVLSAFLLGVAFGSLKAKKICEHNNSIIEYMIKVLVAAALFYICGTSLFSWIIKYSGSLGLIFGFISIAISSFLLGGIFPILSHISIHADAQKIGSKISWIYCANIIGSTLGCIITGFYLLEWFRLIDIIVFISVLIFIPVILLMLYYKKKISYSFIAVIGVFVTLCVSKEYIYLKFYENIFAHSRFMKPNSLINFKHISENRTGVIAIAPNKNGDIIYGSGAYDGTFNINPAVNSNGIMRAYAISILHADLQDILMIGLSGGAWAKVASTYAPLKSLDIVEINKGYLDIIQHYPDIADITTHPKVKIYIDDGRRWMKNNPSKKYDMIVMNTIYHWRNNATNLISQEFLTFAKQYLRPHGVIYMNNTGAEDITYTAAHIFKYVTTIGNLVAMSDSPFNVSAKKRQKNLGQFYDKNGDAIFNHHNQNIKQKLVDYKFPQLEKNIKKRQDLWLITEDNMATEYKKR